jgi:hypothetical protein
MLGSCSGGFLRGLHHRFLHTVFACPIQTDLVAIGIIEVGMSPTPGHHAWQLGDVEAFLLKLAAEVVELSDFEVQTHAVAQTEASAAAWCRAIVPSPPGARRRA